jgi:ABC-type transport system substrate-binding protein
MLSNLNMRLAIAHTINTSEIVEKALNGYGYPARGMYTPVISWAFNPNASLPAYDPMKAEKILNQLGI